MSCMRKEFVVYVVLINSWSEAVMDFLIFSSVWMYLSAFDTPPYIPRQIDYCSCPCSAICTCLIKFRWNILTRRKFFYFLPVWFQYYHSLKLEVVSRQELHIIKYRDLLLLISVRLYTPYSKLSVFCVLVANSQGSGHSLQFVVDHFNQLSLQAIIWFQSLQDFHHYVRWDD